MLHHDLKRRIRELFDRFATWVTVLVLLLWIVGQFVPFVGNEILSEGFLLVVVVALLVEALKRLSTLTGASTTRIVRCQDDALPELLEAIRDERPESADLIENAGATIRPLLAALREARADVRLLLCHPEWAGNATQRESMRNNINVSVRELRDYGRAEIRVYRVPQSLRGRKLVAAGAGLLNVGWYASRFEEEGRWVHGHDNAMVVARLDTEDGRHLTETFDRVFSDLWDASTTIDARELPGITRRGG